MKPHKLMLALFLTVTLLIAGTVAFHISSEPSEGAIHSFEIKLTAKAENISLDCISGCNWINVRFTDSNIYTVHKGGTSLETGFSMSTILQRGGYIFSVNRNENEVVLKSRRGTNWDSLTITCPSMSCSFRFNEDGVINVRGN